MLALNGGFPGHDQLRSLLLWFEPTILTKALKPRSAEIPPIKPPDECDITEFFGTRYQTTAILAICLAGGEIDQYTLDRIVHRDGAQQRNRITSIQQVVERGIIKEHGSNYRLALGETKNQKLIDLVNALVVSKTDLARLKPYIKRRPAHQLPKGTNYNWNDTLDGWDSPVGPAAGRDGAPLLCKSNARFRYITALAAYQPVSPGELQRTLKITKETFHSLLRDRLIVSDQVNRDRDAIYALVSINPGIPAYDEFVAFFKKLETKWPAPEPTKRYNKPHTPTPIPWGGPLSNLLGSRVRGDTLLMLATLGKVDVTTITRLVPEYHNQDIARTLNMLTHFGMVRSAGRDANALLAELDPHWFAARELKTLLDAIISTDPRYAGLRNAASMVYPRKTKVALRRAGARKALQGVYETLANSIPESADTEDT